jgi:hypothetical protein
MKSKSIDQSILYRTRRLEMWYTLLERDFTEIHFVDAPTTAKLSILLVKFVLYVKAVRL